MNRSKKSSPRSIVLKHNIKIEATPVAFTRLDSVKHLDLDRLSRAASARIEFGYFDAGCCRRMVHAVVRKGKVVKLELEPCKEPVRMTPELKQTLQAVGRKLRAHAGDSTALPLPVDQVFASPFHISGWFCIKICAFGHCLICCMHLGAGRPWADCAIDKLPTPF